MPLVPGTRLGPYEIVSLLGRGGMGEVYRARDAKLRRDVALKTLSDRFVSHPDRVRRFEQEALAAAALNHPNIVTVYAVDRFDDVTCLTMELVDGGTLATVIPRDGLPLDQLLKLAIPLVDGVSAAHKRGITHRDLKPANVMVTADRRPKILDFGLAKLADDANAPETLTGLPTETITAEGVVLGTVAYMSPEQVEGKIRDHRSDIFSLGVILYEMATGERPFKGDSGASLLSSILTHTPPPVGDIKAMIPSELGRIIRHALVKDRERRYQTAADLRNELEELKQDLDSGAVVVHTSRALADQKIAPLRWPLVAAYMVAIVSTAAALYLWAKQPAKLDAPASRLETSFMQLTTRPGLEQFPSVSPDGKWVVYQGDETGNADIYLQSIGGQNAINLTRDEAEDDRQPMFSPDGESIAFRSERQGGGIFIMGRTGESVRRITDTGYNPAWSLDGTRLAFTTDVLANPLGRNPNSQLWIVTLATGEKRQLAVPDAVQPSWSPDGQRIAYWGLPAGRTQRDIWTIAVDGGGGVMPVTSDAALDWNPVWSPDGRFLYFSSDRAGSMNLWRVAIDEQTGRVIGNPESLTTPSLFAGQMSVSADGRRLAFASSAEAGSIARVAFDPVAVKVLGSPDTVLAGSRVFRGVVPSPDGTRLTFYSDDRQRDIFIAHGDGTGLRQLTNDAAYDRQPRWSPDGQLITFSSNRSGNYQIWSIKPDGSALTRITNAPDGLMMSVWSPNGTQMVSEDGGALEPHLYVFDPRRPWNDQTPSIVPRTVSPGLVFTPIAWSPNGERLAGYVGSGIGNYTAVYSFAEQRFTRVTERGDWPAWLNDSRRLLIPVDNKLLVVDTMSRTTRQIMSIPSDAIDSIALTADYRTLYFARASQQADIWLMTIK